MANETQAGTVSATVQSEVKATAANIKQMGLQGKYAIFMNQTVVRMQFSYELNHREFGRLVVDELERIEADEALVNEIRRTYVGG